MNKKNKALFWVLVFSFLWSFAIINSRHILSKGIEIFSMTFQSQVVVIIIMFFVLLFNIKKYKSVKRKSLPWLLFFGISGSGLGIGFSYVGLNLSSTINYGFIIKTSAVFTVLIAHFWHHDEKMNRLKGILTFTFMLGIYLLSTNGRLIIPETGDLLILFGAFMLGLSNNILKVILKFKVDSQVIVLFRMIGAALVSVVFILIYKNPFFTPGVFPFIVINGILMAIFLYAVNRTVEYSSASYLSMMSIVVPLIVAVLSIFILKETLQIYQIIGGGIILISSYVLEKNR